MTMKTCIVAACSSFVTLITVALLFWFFVIPAIFPLRWLFGATKITRVETQNRSLGSVIEDVVKQVESKGNGPFRILFAPEALAGKVRERDGGVFGNPTIEGAADEAIFILACDYRCHIELLNKDTIICYIGTGDPPLISSKSEFKP